MKIIIITVISLSTIMKIGHPVSDTRVLAKWKR